MLVEPLEGPDIIDDFEIAAEEEKAIQHRDENLMKLRRRIEQYKVRGRGSRKCFGLRGSTILEFWNSCKCI
jgi:hypothetical protein